MRTGQLYLLSGKVNVVCAGARLICFLHFYCLFNLIRVFRSLWASDCSFFNLRLKLHSFFALYGRASFLCVAKEKGPKERPPYCVGLRLLCALQLTAGAAELAIAQTVLALFRSKPAVLDNTKGALRSKTRSKSGLVAPDIQMYSS